MAATSTDPVERLEAALRVGAPAPSRRMLIIVNPYATTVSDRLKNLVVYALRGSYQVDAIDTESKDHATELCREAAQEGYDVVVAFGGDGTVNEAANGLVGIRYAAELSARGTDERVLPDARDPDRRRRRDRAPAPDGRRLAAAARRHRPGQRPVLHVLGRRRARRERRRAGRRPPASEGPARRVLLHVGRSPDVQPPLSRCARRG